MVGFGWWQNKYAPVEPVDTPKEEVAAEDQVNETPVFQDELVTDMERRAESSVADSNAFVPEELVVENENLKLTFSTLGARLLIAEVKEYQTYDSLPVLLVANNQTFDIQIPGQGGLSTQEFIVEEHTSSRLALKSGNTSVKIQLPEQGYDLKYIVSGNSSAAGKPKLFWERDVQRTEKGLNNERAYSTFAYETIEDGDVDHLAMRGSDKDKEVDPVNWIAQKQHFFSVIVNPESGFTASHMVTVNGQKEDEKKVKTFSVSTEFDQTVDGAFTLPMEWYIGPNHYQTLKDYGKNYHKVIQFGWGIFGWIGRGVVVPIFNWLEGYGLNYGIIILIMVLIIKISLSPLTFASYRSQAKMRVLKPQLDAINEKFGDKDQVAKQQAQMKLYKEAGVNPLGGCIPVLVTMPVLIAMFRFFPSSIELRGESFLWATDLSTYDDLISWDTYVPILSSIYGNHVSIFTVLMTISTIIYTRMNQQMTASTANSEQMKQIQNMMYFMPIIFMFMLNRYPAGLTYYYFLSNIITFGMQWIIRKSLDDKKILAKLEAKKAQPKKKSKFQDRLEEMQRQGNVNRQQRRKGQ